MSDKFFGNPVPPVGGEMSAAQAARAGKSPGVAKDMGVQVNTSRCHLNVGWRLRRNYVDQLRDIYCAPPLTPPWYEGGGRVPRGVPQYYRTMGATILPMLLQSAPPALATSAMAMAPPAPQAPPAPSRHALRHNEPAVGRSARPGNWRAAAARPPQDANQEAANGSSEAPAGEEPRKPAWFQHLTRRQQRQQAATAKQTVAQRQDVSNWRARPSAPNSDAQSKETMPRAPPKRQSPEPPKQQEQEQKPNPKKPGPQAPSKPQNQAKVPKSTNTKKVESKPGLARGSQSERKPKRPPPESARNKPSVGSIQSARRPMAKEESRQPLTPPRPNFRRRPDTKPSENASGTTEKGRAAPKETVRAPLNNRKQRQGPADSQQRPKPKKKNRHPAVTGTTTVSKQRCHDSDGLVRTGNGKTKSGPADVGIPGGSRKRNAKHNKYDPFDNTE